MRDVIPVEQGLEPGAELDQFGVKGLRCGGRRCSGDR
jgi:hypothetical protein